MKYLIELSDEEKKVVTDQDLLSMKKSAEEFDGFESWRMISKLPLEPAKRLSDHVCMDCGSKYVPDKEWDGQPITFNRDQCGLCCEEKLVTHIRIYNYLNENN